MADLPTVVTKEGLQPQTPAAIRAALLADVASTNPGYTATLPGSLIEDISSTDVAAIALCDAARVELVDSLTPRGANAWLLLQLGQIYGVEPGAASNTSVSVVFTGPPGFVIAKGFVVSDGTYQYALSDGGVVGAGGQSQPLFAVATTTGSWAVAPNTVAFLVTSVPSTIELSVTNPLAGTPGGAAQTEESYRADVLQAGLAVAQGMGSFLKTQLRNVPGVQSRLISVRQVPNNGGWQVLGGGGGDPYEVAYAIYDGLFDINMLVGSTIRVTGITNANPGVVTTDINHNYATGQACEINGVVGMTPINGVPLVATVIDEKTFSIGVDTSSYPSYVSGGVVTPNLRNQVVTLNDYPDVYAIVFINPPQQSVSIAVTWNTTASNFVSSASIAQLATPALVDYVNSIPVGAPINLYELQTVFQEAVASALSPALLTRMVFEVSINGIGTDPEPGTGIIAGDPESYFQTDSSLITVTQG